MQNQDLAQDLEIFHEFTAKQQIAYLNPAFLFDRKWKIADWLFLRFGDKMALIQVLPAEKIPFGFIQISEADKNDLNTNVADKVSVCMQDKPILKAARIIIKINEKVEAKEMDLFLLTVQQTLLELHHVIKGKKFMVGFKTRMIKCIITDISTINGKVEDDYIYKVTSKVVVSLDEKIVSPKLSKVLYSDIGGLSKELEDMISIVNLGLYQSSMFTDLGFKPVKGILLYGPPGVSLII